MRGIARLAMRGPLQAVSIALAFALTGLLFAPSLVLGGAVIGLVVLREGLYEATKVAALAALCAGLVLQVALGAGTSGLVVLLPWVPIVCAARILRSSAGGRGVAWRCRADRPRGNPTNMRAERHHRRAQLLATKAAHGNRRPKVRRVSRPKRRP